MNSPSLTSTDTTAVEVREHVAGTYAKAVKAVKEFHEAFGGLTPDQAQQFNRLHRHGAELDLCAIAMFGQQLDMFGGG